MTGSLLQLSDAIGNTEGLVFLFPAVIAIAGVFVAYQAYRGYQRNQSQPMLYLALGIVLLTAVPASINLGLSSLTTATEAGVLLAITVAHLTGVAAILYALTRA